MIVCTKCGRKNEDDSRYCEDCGRKPQSRFKGMSGHSGPFFLEENIPSRFREMLGEGIGKYVEAWLYVLLLAVTAIACMWENDYRPLYIAGGLVGLIAWLRKI